MLRTDAGRKPEHPVIGTTLTTLAVFCVAAMYALGKVTANRDRVLPAAQKLPVSKLFSGSVLRGRRGCHLTECGRRRRQ